MRDCGTGRVRRDVSALLFARSRHAPRRRRTGGADASANAGSLLPLAGLSSASPLLQAV